MRLSVQAKSARLVRQGLEDLEKQTPDIGRKRLYDLLKKAISERFQKYAPKRPRQKYQRTFKFKRGWRLRRKGNDGYTVENVARHKGKAYGRFVVGDAYGTGQASVHAGRWWVFRDVMEDVLKQLPIDTEKNIHMVARRNPGWRAGGAG